MSHQVRVRDIVNELGCEVAAGRGWLGQPGIIWVLVRSSERCHGRRRAGRCLDYCADTPEYRRCRKLTGVSAIIVAGGANPAHETVLKADEEGIPY